MTEDERTGPAPCSPPGPVDPAASGTDLVLVIRAWRDPAVQPPAGARGGTEPGTEPDDIRARILGVGAVGPVGAGGSGEAGWDGEPRTVAVAEGLDGICAAVRRLLSPPRWPAEPPP